MNIRVAIAVFSHWRRHPAQLFTLIVGLGMATALWTGVQAINSEARASYERANLLSDLTSLTRVERLDGAAIGWNEFRRLRRSGLPVTPLIFGVYSVGDQDFELIGLDPFTHPTARLFATGGAGRVWNGIDGAAAILANPLDAATLGLSNVVPYEALPPGRLLSDISVVDALIGAQAYQITLGIPAESASKLPDEFTATQPPESVDFAGLTDSFHLNLTAFGGLSFVVGLFILYSGIGLAVEQRRASFRTMRAIGVPLRNLVLVLAAELLILAVLAGGLGVVLGYFVAAALLPDVSATLKGLYGVSGGDALSLRIEWVLAGLALAVLGTFVAGISALRKVARMPLLAIGQTIAWAGRTRKLSFGLALIGLAGLASACAMFFAIGGLLGAFVMLGGVLLAGACVVPAYLSWSLEWLERISVRPLTIWFWADTRSQLSGLSLALTALMLAIAANIGVGTMVSSFRASFDGFLDQRLASDLYVQVEDNAQGEAFWEWAKPRAKYVVPIWDAEITIGNRPADIFGIIDSPIYREKWPMIQAAKTVWTDLFEGRGALISEQMSNKSGFDLGDIVELGPDWTVRVVGIYADYGNTGDQLAVALPEFLANFPEIEKDRFGVTTLDGEIEDLRAQLIEEFGLTPSQITDRQTIRDFSMSVFERTFTVTGALNVLTMGIAVFAILTSLMTLSVMRIPQLAPVWAIGLTRSQLAGLEILRAVALAVLIFGVALPVGLGLAWVLLRVLNVEAFGWQLPMAFFPIAWAKLLGFAIAAAAVSALWSAVSLARLSPAQLTQVFANER